MNTRSESQIKSQQKYRKRNPVAVANATRRYREKNVDKYMAYNRKSALKHYHANKNYIDIENMATTFKRLFLEY
jgi:hypothetical protein